jgi:uncharacterized membrane protein
MNKLTSARRIRMARSTFREDLPPLALPVRFGEYLEMSRYELLVFLHIGATIVWIGAGFLIAVLVLGAERAGDRLKQAGHHRDVGWLAPRLFIPASLATLVVGILLVLDGPASFGDAWIVVGLTGWAVSFLLGFFYFKPEGERIGALVEQHGPGHPEVERRLHRLNVVDRIQLMILFLVVANMVVKPSGDDVAVLVVGAGILTMAAVVGAASIRRRSAGGAASGPAPAG